MEVLPEIREERAVAEASPPEIFETRSGTDQDGGALVGRLDWLDVRRRQDPSDRTPLTAAFGASVEVGEIVADLVHGFRLIESGEQTSQAPFEEIAGIADASVPQVDVETHAVVGGLDDGLVQIESVEQRLPGRGLPGLVDLGSQSVLSRRICSCVMSGLYRNRSASGGVWRASLLPGRF